MTQNLLSSSVDGGAKFICDSFHTDDPVMAVRKAVGEMFANVRSQLPVDLDPLLAKRGITIILGEVPPRKEAILKPVPKGFRLIIADQPRRQASLFQDSLRRFTLAHEIIETYFFASELDTPVHWTRLPGYRAFVTPAALSSGGFEERLCDYGAGLILVPTRKIDEVTDHGARVPDESSLLRAATQCSTGPLNLCHRIASYLRVRHSTHALVGLVKKCSDPNSEASDVAWRFAPTKKGAGHPVGVDIDATLNHKFFLATNKTLLGLGFTALAKWLDNGADKRPPIGEEADFQQHGVAARLKVRYATFDHRRGAAVVWFELAFRSRP